MRARAAVPASTSSPVTRRGDERRAKNRKPNPNRVAGAAAIVDNSGRRTCSGRITYRYLTSLSTPSTSPSNGTARGISPLARDFTYSWLRTYQRLFDPILARSSTLADLRLAPRAGRARLVRAAMTACYYRAYFAGERDQFRARVGNQFPGSRRFPRHLYSPFPNCENVIVTPKLTLHWDMIGEF